MNPWRATIWAVTLALAAAAGYSAAVTAALILERQLTPPLDQAAGQRAGRAAAVARERRESGGRERTSLATYSAILDDNLFTFQARRAKSRAPARRPVRAAAGTAPAPEAALPFTATVTGTLLAGEESFAVVIGAKGGGEQVYKLGECLPEEGAARKTRCAADQAKLVLVETDRIVVLHGGSEIPLHIASGPEPRVAARSAREENSKARSTLSAAERRRERLANRKVGQRRDIDRAAKDGTEPDDTEEAEEPAPNTFPMERDGNNYHVTVPNAEVEKAFENFSEVASQAAAVPIIENGEAQGFQLRKIRAGSIFQRLGLRNNDLVISVNGESLTTADQALRLFTAFRNEREITLDIKRGGEDVRLNYSVE